MLFFDFLCPCSEEDCSQEAAHFFQSIDYNTTGDAVRKEYLLQGFDFSLRLQEKEKVAEVLVVRSLLDPCQYPSLTQGRPPFPVREYLRTQGTKIQQSPLRPHLLGLSKDLFIVKTIIFLYPLQILPSLLFTKGMALLVDGGGDKEMQRAGDPDPYIIQFLGNASFKYVI